LNPKSFINRGGEKRLRRVILDQKLILNNHSLVDKQEEIKL